MKSLNPLLLMCALSVATAQAAPSKASSAGFNPAKTFFGAGISRNSISGSDDGTGMQVFGGYRFGEIGRGLKLDGELGYMDTGDMDVVVNVPFFGRVVTTTDAKGLWTTAVLRVNFSQGMDGIGRIGLDFGDDDGLMAGIGLGFNLSKTVQMRIEYVERDHVDSAQLNLVIGQ